MKIDINGTIRDMTEKEIKEHAEAVQSATETPKSIDEKVDNLTNMVQGLVDMLQSKFFA